MIVLFGGGGWFVGFVFLGGRTWLMIRFGERIAADMDKVGVACTSSHDSGGREFACFSWTRL